MDLIPNEILRHILQYNINDSNSLYTLSLVDWKFYNVVKTLPGSNTPKIADMTHYIRIKKRLNDYLLVELGRIYTEILDMTKQYFKNISNITIYNGDFAITAEYINDNGISDHAYIKTYVSKHINDCEISIGNWTIRKYGSWIHYPTNLVPCLTTERCMQLINYLVQQHEFIKIFGYSGIKCTYGKNDLDKLAMINHSH